MTQPGNQIAYRSWTFEYVHREMNRTRSVQRQISLAGSLIVLLLLIGVSKIANGQTKYVSLSMQGTSAMPQAEQTWATITPGFEPVRFSPLAGSDDFVAQEPNFLCKK